MPKLKLGAAVYALVAIGLAASAVAVLQRWGAYAGVHGWPVGATAVVDALSALLFVIGAVTRRGLIADDGPWICRNGWLVLGGLTAAGMVVALLSEGVAEAELEITAVRGEESPPGP